MTTPKFLLLNAIDPAFAMLTLLGVKSDDRARVLALAIAGQESEWKARLQVPVAYARSYWQFEKGGGVTGVLRHPASASKILAICSSIDVTCNIDTVYEAMAWHDVLAAAMARLLLWVDPAPFPAVGDMDASWEYYKRNWRPGAPHRDVWNVRYTTAMHAVTGT